MKHKKLKININEVNLTIKLLPRVYPDPYTMSSSDSSQGPPSSTSRKPPPSRLMTRSALASFTSPSFPAPTPPSGNRFRATGFSVERIYEFEAPQFYDFTKQSDPERGHLDEHWFGIKQKIIFIIVLILFIFRFEKENSFKS